MPEYKTIFGYYVKKYTDQFFNRSFLDPYIEKIKDKISPFRVNDVYASLDYGYTYADFLKSYESATGAHVKSGLKEYIGTRNSSVKSQLLDTDIAPIVDHLNTKWTNTYSTVQFNITSLSALQVKAYVKIGDNNQQFSLKDDGVFPDIKAGDNIYTCGFNFVGKPSISLYLEVSDQQGKNTRWPRCSMYSFTPGNNPVPKLIINEFMAENTAIADNAGEFEDWIEIYNADNKSVFLGDKYLTDKALSPDKWKMPDISLSPGQFLLIWADEDQEQGSNHCNFKLSKSGEFIGIFDSKENNFAAIDSFSFGSTVTNKSYGRYPDGMGSIVPLSIATPGKSNVLTSTIDDKFLKLKIYPLPASEYIFIEGLEKGDKIKFSNIQGLTVFDMNNFSDNTVKIQINHLEKGMYFLSIERNKNFISRPIVLF